jgi:hypothetical protein
MTGAIDELRGKKTKEALPPEQRSLQQLLRAEAIFRDIQVARGGGQGQGASQQEQQELADLFELQLDKMKNQYETVQREQQQNQSQQQDEIGRQAEQTARTAEQNPADAEKARRDLAKNLAESARKQAEASDKLGKLEQKARFTLPEEYRNFLKRFGAGDIGTITVLSPDPESDFSLWKNQEPFEKVNWIPVVDDGKSN